MTSSQYVFNSIFKSLFSYTHLAKLLISNNTIEAEEFMKIYLETFCLIRWFFICFYSTQELNFSNPTPIDLTSLQALIDKNMLNDMNISLLYNSSTRQSFMTCINSLEKAGLLNSANLDKIHKHSSLFFLSCALQDLSNVDCLTQEYFELLTSSSTSKHFINIIFILKAKNLLSIENLANITQKDLSTLNFTLSSLNTIEQDQLTKILSHQNLGSLGSCLFKLKTVNLLDMNTLNQILKKEPAALRPLSLIFHELLKHQQMNSHQLEHYLTQDEKALDKSYLQILEEMESRKSIPRFR